MSRCLTTPAGKIDVQGWVTLTNSSGTTYDNAATTLVAGSPMRAGQYDAQQYVRRPQRPQLAQAGTETGDRERLGDFYLYPLAERTTIANMQTKQVSFLDVHDVPAVHGYEFRNYWLGTQEEPQSAKTVYRFSTGSAEGPRRPAPRRHPALLHPRQAGRPAIHRGKQRSTTRRWAPRSRVSTGDAFDVKVKAGC